MILPKVVIRHFDTSCNSEKRTRNSHNERRAPITTNVSNTLLSEYPQRSNNQTIERVEVRFLCTFQTYEVDVDGASLSMETESD